MVKVRQDFYRPLVEDIEEEFLAKLHQKRVLDQFRKGQTVAIAVGSRGITNQPLVVKLLVQELFKVGAAPFIIPAMGSHGGATAQGQKDMLIGMGIQEDYVGAPIRSTMEVVQVGDSDNGVPVYIDKLAYEADAIIIINRVKPHVGFRGPFESGLMKMIAIGLGKHEGAVLCHELGFGKMAENIPAMGRVALEKANILFGIALLENAYHETCRVEILSNEEIQPLEPGLQEEAKKLAPRLHFDTLDVLIIDEIGKDISGTGFDTNVVGRYHTPYATGGPDITRIAALDITEKSHGNANGLGILDFTTMRAFKKFIFEQTYPNALTSTVPTTVKIPMVLKNDRQAIQAAIRTCNILGKENVKMLRIKNTTNLREIEISENLIPGIQDNKYLDVISEAYQLSFDESGNLF
jgi:hypothetical protein